jgi:hypothetical protein
MAEVVEVKEVTYLLRYATMERGPDFDRCEVLVGQQRVGSREVIGLAIPMPTLHFCFMDRTEVEFVRSDGVRELTRGEWFNPSPHYFLGRLAKLKSEDRCVEFEADYVECRLVITSIIYQPPVPP